VPKNGYENRPHNKPEKKQSHIYQLLGYTWLLRCDCCSIQTSSDDNSVPTIPAAYIATNGTVHRERSAVHLKRTVRNAARGRGFCREYYTSYNTARYQHEYTAVCNRFVNISVSSNRS
jgi:hypothetical protein